MSRKETEKLANERTTNVMKKLAALHEPDMATGGYHQPGHIGHKDVNESIGGSWNQEGRLAGVDREVDKAIANQQGSGNLKLEVCRGKDLR